LTNCVGFHSQILKDFKDKGEEELALEESMQKKTAAARRKAATKSQRSEYNLQCHPSESNQRVRETYTMNL